MKVSLQEAEDSIAAMQGRTVQALLRVPQQ